MGGEKVTLNAVVMKACPRASVHLGLNPIARVRTWEWGFLVLLGRRPGIPRSRDFGQFAQTPKSRVRNFASPIVSVLIYASKKKRGELVQKWPR